MTLKDYMERKGLSVNDVAKAVGIFPASIRQHLNGGHLRPHNEEKIVNWSKGKVKYSDLRPYIKKKGKAA